MNFQESTNAANAFTNKEQSLITSEYKVDPNLKKIPNVQCFTVSSQSNTIKYVKTTEKSFEFPVIDNKIVQGESLEEIFDKKKIDKLSIKII